MGWSRVALALVFLCNAGVCINAFSVSASVGEIVGFEDAWKNVTVRTFLGIPYAEAPIDDLRFNAPVPKAPLNSPFEAKKFGSPCIQNVENMASFSTNTNVSEDCLSLNIYIPKGGEAKKAVMVWIHGGGYTAGAGEHYDGKMIAAASDIVVVTLNYRLGVFGFFTTGDASASGNYGLLDQQLALKWVQQNIGAFGGDESRVTIFGESAGAGSVSWLMLAPSNQGLFKRVIAQSGVASAPWSFPNPKTALAYTKNLALALGCDSSDSYEMASCLRKLPSSAFGQETAEQYPYATPGTATPAGPRVDGTFIPVSPACRSQGHRIEELPLFRSVDLLSGANEFESEPFFTTGMMAFSRSDSDQVPKAIFDIFNTAFVGMEDKVAAEKLWGRYAMGQAQMPNGKELLEYLGDAMFYRNIMDITNRHANSSTGSTYFYSLLPKPSNIVGRLTDAYGFPPSVFADGAIHGDDLGFLFGNTSMWMGDDSAPGEKDLSAAMITYWTNFAKSGNPNSPSAVSFQWPEYTTEEKAFIEFDIQNSTLDLHTNTDYRSRYMRYWSDIKPELESYCITAGASTVRCGLSFMTIIGLVSMVFGLFHQG